MPETFSTVLKELEKLHSRSERYLTIRNSEYLFRENNGINDCFMLFEAIENYIKCMIDAHRGHRLDESARDSCINYVFRIRQIQEDIRKFNGVRQINANTINNSTSAWANVWRKRKAFDGELLDDCGYDNLKSILKRFWD